ncbi:hypothetical protein SprV_0602228700 [Sparganum proliferum]
MEQCKASGGVLTGTYEECMEWVTLRRFVAVFYTNNTNQCHRCISKGDSTLTPVRSEGSTVFGFCNACKPWFSVVLH